MKRNFCVALMLVLVVSLIAGSASAGLIIDLRAVPGQAGVIDTKNVQGDTGASYTFQVWCRNQGNGTVDDAVTTISGGIQLTGGGALSLLHDGTNVNGYDPTFDESTAAVFESPTLLGRGGLTSVVDQLWWRAVASQPFESDPGEKLLGVFKYTFGDTPGSITYLKPGVYVGGLTFRTDGTNRTGNTAGLAQLSAGTALVCTPVPEPSTIALLGMSALALIFIRRRK